MRTRFARLALCCGAAILGSAFVFETSALPIAAEGSLAYLRRVMDAYHDRVFVYEDVSSPGNHFHAWAKIPKGAAVLISGSSTNNPNSGATAIRAEFQDVPGSNYGGFYFLNGVLPDGEAAPLPNFGSEPDAGFLGLVGATRVCFSLRGEVGNSVDILVAGVGRDPVSGIPTEPFPDSNPVIRAAFPLTSSWVRHCIDVASANLSYVLGGFGWVTSDTANPGGAVFYLDDIVYELSPAAQTARLNQPRLLRSYSTLPFQELPPPEGTFDLRNRNLAYTYDNALAILAFLLDETPDGLRRARLIADAFVYASNHDRFYDDGRLRDAYAAGDLALPPGWTPNGRSGTVPIPGYFDEVMNLFIEIEQEGLSTGNLTWAMLALLAVYERTGENSYLELAQILASLIETHFRSDSGTYQGFRGGFDSPESPSPVNRTWASSEHNLDLAASLATLFVHDHDPVWLNGAQHARSFVEAMWETARGCYLAGTSNPETRNDLPGQLPLDVQAWAVQALPNVLITHPDLLDCPESFHRLTHHGFNLFDFNDDLDGVWFEGSAQMAVTYHLAGRAADADTVRDSLRSAQTTPPFGDNEGIAAACHSVVSSGFGFGYFRRLHVGATAWHVFAATGANPFQIHLLFADGFEAGNTSAWTQVLP